MCEDWRVFEYWIGELAAPLQRVVDPPQPVAVDLAGVFPPAGVFRRDGVSLRVKRAGLAIRGVRPGLLYAWARCIDGQWIGLVAFAIKTGDEQGRIETRQWCPAGAISPLESRSDLS